MMINILLVFILSIVLCSNDSDSTISNDKIIQLPFNLILNTFASQMYFGSNKQSLFQRINLVKQYTWFIKESFNSSASSSYKFIQNKELDFGFTSVIADESTDTVEIYIDNTNSFILNDFSFYLVNNSDYFGIRYGSFGLAYKFIDDRFSIIHQLHKLNYISRLAFGFYPHFHHRGIFYLGGLPKKKLNQTYSASCKVKDNDSNWSCSLSQIYFTQKANDKSNEPNSATTKRYYAYHNNDQSYFQSAESKIFTPIKYMMHLVSTLFKPLIDSKTCFFDMRKGFAIIYCEDSIKMNEYYIHFVINNYAYSINLQNLFTCEYRLCELDIISSKWNKNTWVLGTGFLKHFYSDFDYEKKMITFYSNFEVFEYVGDGFVFYRQIALIVNFGILFIFSLVIIVIKNKFNSIKIGS